MRPEPSLDESAVRDISEQIKKVIRNRTGGAVHALQVDVDDGSVVLSGQTSTFYNKQLATHAAQSAANGRLLSNEIQVR